MYRLDIVPGLGRSSRELAGGTCRSFWPKKEAMRNHKPDLTPAIKYEPEPVVYRVKSGDVLGTIARKHGVKVSQLKAWNDLNSSVIRVGQSLIIHANPNTL